MFVRFERPVLWRQTMNRFNHRNVASALLLGALSSCGSDATGLASESSEDPESVAERADPLWSHAVWSGKRAFTRAFPGSNGRACATCHVLSESTTLTPANVEARL